MSTQFPVHTTDSAPAASRETMTGVRRTFGFIPNLIGVMAESPAALNGYLNVSAAFTESSLSPVEQQTVLLTTSVENGCTYCVAAHSLMFEKAGGDAAALKALRDGGTIAGNPRLESLRRFALEVVQRRGWVGESSLRDFLDAGFTKAQVFEVVLGVTQKTLSNYINHIAGTPDDSAFAKFSWQPQASEVA